MPTEVKLPTSGPSHADAMRCTPEEALSTVGELAQDTRAMASALARRLGELVVRHAELGTPEAAHRLVGVRDMAVELEEFLTWAIEDPIKLTIQLKCIEADLPVEF